jgi:hypothetical protein
LLIKRAILLLELDIGKPWLDTAGIAQQILFVYCILVGLSRSIISIVIQRDSTEHSQSDRSPAGTQMFDPSVRAAGVISGSKASLALRHSVRAGSDHTKQKVSMEEWLRRKTRVGAYV